MSVGITPVAHAGAPHAGIAWASWIEAALSCAAIVALLPLFDLVAVDPAGRADRFAAWLATSALLAAKNEAARELLRTAGWQWSGAMLLGALFVAWGRVTRSRLFAAACALGA